MDKVKNDQFKEKAAELVSKSMKRIRSIGNIKRDCQLGKKDMHVFFSKEVQEDIVESLREEIDNLKQTLMSNGDTK